MNEAKADSFFSRLKSGNQLKKPLFLLSFFKMRLSVTFGIRKTSYPLNVMWWWQHQSFLQLKDIYSDLNKK